MKLEELEVDPSVRRLAAIEATRQARDFESLRHRRLPEGHAASPLFDTVVNYQGATMKERGGKGFVLRFRQLAATHPMQWFLVLRVVKNDESTFHVTLEFWQDIVPESSVMRESELLKTSLLQIASS
ncbi:hypothetical protein B0J12DRAFT_741716 [Macrophomina phaseolina]|uniref:Uncharacterized protein n=1 Tax=Macrophomina phaseolina TaxID=35725 RepID=A0ABQ8G9N9_9PEZI|nr:hypothetical protein B0J12DRAFT_741716 [Macrophomina phaseolina]